MSLKLRTKHLRAERRCARPRIYDGEGNTTQTVGITGGPDAGLTWDYSYNNDNQLAEATETQETTSGTIETVGQQIFHYDAQGNLFETDTWTATAGLNVERYLYDASGNQWAQVDASGNPQTIQLYLPGVNQPLAQVAGSSSTAPVTTFDLVDYLGSLDGLVDTTGTLIDYRTYGPYGQLAAETNPAAGGQIGYAGGQTDSVTGTEHFGARDTTNNGRWLQQDPDFPQSGIDPYVYVNDNPTNEVDPTGLDGWFASFESWMDRNVGDWIGQKYNDSAGFRGTVNAVDQLAHAPLDAAQASITDPTGVVRTVGALQRIKQGYDVCRAGGENVAGSIFLGFLLPVSDMVGTTNLNEGYHHSELITNRPLSEDESVTKTIVGSVKVTVTALAISEALDAVPGEGGEPSAAKTKFCFPAGTLVSTEQGLRPIESILPGERVWAYDLVTREWRLCRVKPCSLEYKGTSVATTVGGETVESTYRHPYWVVRGEALECRPWLEHLAFVPKEATTPGRWVDSCDLRAGDEVLLRDGRVLPVELVSLRPFDGTVYNMEVEELQCYAVGQSGILVHNNNSPETGPTGAPQAAPIVRGTNPSRVTFEGMEVRAVRDLSHLDEGTLRAMQERGFAATDINGQPLQLHHLNQNSAGPLVEIPAPAHDIGNPVQHPFGNQAGAGLTAEQRAAFNDWRTRYWQERAREELARRGLQ